MRMTRCVVAVVCALVMQSGVAVLGAQTAGGRPQTKTGKTQVRPPLRSPECIAAATQGDGMSGDTVTEKTVDKVLWYLKGCQSSEGSWPGGQSSLANTAFAVLTFLAHGECPGSRSSYSEEFGPVVAKGIDYLCNAVETDGRTVRMKGSDGNEYAFLIGTYALCEAYGLTKDNRCKECALQCLTRIVRGQSATGGWDYKINPNSTRDDMSFAGWAIQALKAGKMAGLSVEGLDNCIKKAICCLKTRNFKNGGFNYTAGGNPTGLTAAGCFAMQFLGHGTQPEVIAALDYMRDWQPSFEGFTLSGKSQGAAPQYYCYYATQCKYQAGTRRGATRADETAWRKWNLAMKKLYPASIIDGGRIQDSSGEEHMQGHFENHDAHTSRPIMDTCLVALQLMTYYRYNSFYDKGARGFDVLSQVGNLPSEETAKHENFKLDSFMNVRFGQSLDAALMTATNFSEGVRSPNGNGGVKSDCRLLRPFRKFGRAEFFADDKELIYAICLTCRPNDFSTQKNRKEELDKVRQLLEKKYDVTFLQDRIRNRASLNNANVEINLWIDESNGVLSLRLVNKEVQKATAKRKAMEQTEAERHEHVSEDEGSDML